MTAKLPIAAGLLLLLAAGHSARSAGFYGWADEFLGAWINCKITNSSSQCSLDHSWTGLDSNAPPTWEYVGNQGANAAGRAAAREKIMFRFWEVSTVSCTSVTVNLARFRTTSPPVPGSSCSVASTFVTSSSVTMDSCQFALSDTYVNNRLLPILDFSLEAAGPGTTIGYRSSVTATGISGSSVNQVGCFRISWI